MDTSMQNRDYKYVMQDFTTLYIGARYTYDEMIEEEVVPFKVKTLISNHIKPALKEEAERDNPGEISLESHLYHMEGKGYTYQTYMQLKAKVKISILREKKGKKSYSTEIIPLKDFVMMPPSEKEENGVLIQELIISKLALMAL